MCVDTLLHICTTFIAENVIDVESFEGIPEHIAQNIFEKCVKKQTFDNDGTGSLVLENMMKEYGQNFLSSVKCSDILLVNTFSMSFEAILYHLAELNLTNVCLGDHHDLISSLGRIRTLHTLILVNNHLSSVGFNTMFFQYIVANKGFKQLEKLDMTYNLTSVRSLGMIIRLENLRELAFSLEDEDNNIVFQSKLKKYKFIERPFKENCFSVSSSGWGKDVIGAWEKFVANLRDTAKMNSYTQNSARDFYKCTKPGNGPFKPLLHNKIKCWSYCRIIGIGQATGNQHLHEMRPVKRQKTSLSNSQIQSLL